MAPALILPVSTSSSSSDLTTAGMLHHPSASTSTTQANGISKPPQAPATLAPLDASLTQTTLTSNPRPVPALDSPLLLEQKTCTDHMVTCSWTASAGWSAPQIKPYGPLALMPTASCLHYATECFEGMKLYRGHDDKLRLFRPQRNCERMLRSATRIALPGFEPAELLKLVKKLCALDGPKWLGKERKGYFLYVRPTMIADDPALGVQQPNQALLYVILSCFAPLDEGKEGMRLLTSQNEMVRAWPGGFGWAKVGANYGPTLLAQGEARRRGYGQVLWLYPGVDGRSEVTEAGASNFFICIRKKEGGVELITAELDGKIILEGVTRASVLDLARERLTGPVKTGAGMPRETVEVSERKLYMDELVEAYEDGRIVEAFVAGTAYFIMPVSLISYKGQEMQIPMEMGSTGLYAGLLKGWLRGIMYGKEQHPWGVVVEEEDV